MHFPLKKEVVFLLAVGFLFCGPGSPNLAFAEESGGEKFSMPKGGEGNPGWIEIEAQISSLEARFQAKVHALEALILEKNHLKPTDSRLSVVTTEIGKEDRERRLIAEDLEKQKTILRFRFPERGAARVRKYKKIELKSVKDMESGLGIDGRLNQSVKKMRSQYGSEQNPKQKPVPQPTPGQMIDQEGTIILQK